MGSHQFGQRWFRREFWACFSFFALRRSKLGNAGANPMLLSCKCFSLRLARRAKRRRGRWPNSKAWSGRARPSRKGTWPRTSSAASNGFSDGGGIAYDAEKLRACERFFTGPRQEEKEAVEAAKKAFCRTRPFKTPGNTLHPVDEARPDDNSPILQAMPLTARRSASCWPRCFPRREPRFTPASTIMPAAA